MACLPTTASALQADDREEGPSVSGPSQFMRAAVGERDPGSDHQVFDGARDEDLARLRLGGDAADDINGDSPDLVADQVHFPVWIPARSCLSCPDRGADILRPA